MKKFTKIFSVIVLCAVMVIMSVVPAFASDNPFVENHSIIDCANRYLNDEGNFVFTIKVAKGSPIDSVKIIQQMQSTTPSVSIFGGMYGLKESDYVYSDSTYDVYNYVVDQNKTYNYSYVWITLYYSYDGVNAMASDTANGSTTAGPGYYIYAK